jgi:hypothetical protein
MATWSISLSAMSVPSMVTIRISEPSTVEAPMVTHARALVAMRGFLVRES